MTTTTQNLSMQSQQTAELKPSQSLLNLISVLNPNSLSDLPSLLEAQGNVFSFNHVVEIPVVQELLSDIKDTFSTSNSFSMSSFFKSISVVDENGLTTIGAYSFSLWVFILLCLFIAKMNLTDSLEDQSRKKTINNYIYLVLAILILFTTISTVVNDVHEKEAQKLCELFSSQFDLVNLEMEAFPVSETALVSQSYSPEMLATSFSAIMCLCLGFKVQDKFVSSVMNFTKMNKNQNDNITSIMKNGSNCLSNMCEQVGLENFKEFFYIEVITDGRVKKFDDSARYFLNSLAAGDLYDSSFFSTVYYEIVSEGEKLLKLIEDKYENIIVLENLKKLRLASDRVEQLKRSLGGIRIEPVGVIFKGAPGSMKTVLNDRVSFLVGKYTIPEPWRADYVSDPKTFQFAIPKDKFFDTYNYKKWIVNVDDVFQKRDSVGESDPEPLKIISMINTAEYCLPMARVEEKNSRYFRSPFVFATTNLEKWDMLESVISHEAVRRRFHIEVDVSISPKYCKEKKFDPSTLPFMSFSDVVSCESGAFDSVKSTYVPDDFWIINIVEKRNTKSLPRREIKLEDLVILIIEMHHERIRNFYVNKHVSENVSTSSISKLDEHFGFDSLNDYADLQKETLSFKNTEVLIAQSGKTCEFDYVSGYDCLNYEKQMEHLTSFKTIMRNFRVPFLTRKLTDIRKYLNEFLASLPIDLLVHHSEDFKNAVERFYLFVESVFRERSRAFKHCVSGLDSKRPTTVDFYYNKFKNFFSPVIIFLKQYWHYIAIASLVITIILPKLVLSIKTLFGADVLSQSLDLSKDRSRVGKKYVSLKEKISEITLRPQAPILGALSNHVLPSIDTSLFGEKNNLSDVSVKILKKYFFIIYMIKPDEFGCLKNYRLGHAWNIRGQVFAMPLHFLYVLHDTHKDPNYKGASLVFTTSTRSTKYCCKIEDVLSTFRVSEDSAKNDVCLFTIPGSHSSSTGVFKFLAKQKDMAKLTQTSSFASTVIGTYLSETADSNTLRLVKGYAQLRSEAPVKATWSNSSDTYLLEGVLQYTGDFNAGDCGSMLLIDSNDFENRCIFGMHVAGEKGNYGVASILLQEYIELILNESFVNNYIFSEEEDCLMTTDCPLEAQGPMFPVSILKGEFMTTNAENTQLKKSVLFGKLPEPFREVKLFPAKLRDFTDKSTGEVVSPGKKALLKYDQVPVAFNTKILGDSVASYESLILQHCQGTPQARGIIPLTEALHAFRKVRGISSSTSPGFPLCLDKNENVKKLYYQSIIAGDVVSSDAYRVRIAKLVHDRESMMIDRIRPNVFYKDCLKDEKIPLEKVIAGKTRMFSACDFILLVMYRQYFGAFMSSYFEANLNVGSAIGINPYSTQWDDMSRRLLKFSTKVTDSTVGAGDYSGFDTREFPQVLDAILQIINRWYGNSNVTENLIRRSLWSDIINSKHIWNNEVYDWQTGMPSGNPMTSIINTMYNNILFRMAYGEIGLPIDLFNNTVVVFALGDDNIFSVHELLREKFNEITLAEVMPTLGMVYTTELKGKAIYPFRPLTEVEFLKRSFRRDKSLNRWVAPLRLESIFGTLNWTKSGIIGNQITVDELSSAFTELTLHGKGVFQHYSRKLFDLKGEFLNSYVPSKELSLEFERVYTEALNLQFDFML